MPAPWTTIIRREPRRADQQRATSRRRRAAAIEEGQSALGSYQAVAEFLGITKQAVADIRKVAAEQDPGEPLPEYIEIDLPRVGATALTTAEYEQLAGADREAAARATRTAWWAIATSSARMAQTAQEAEAALAEALVNSDERQGVAELRAAIAENAPAWADAVTCVEDAHALMQVAVDTTASYRRQAAAAHRQVEVWDDRIARG